MALVPQWFCLAKATFPADGLDLIFSKPRTLLCFFLGWTYPHHKPNEWGDRLHLETCSLDIVKGWTKASVIAFVLLAAAECDVDEHWSKLEPLIPFLDKAFLLPTYDSHIKLVLSNIPFIFNRTLPKIMIFFTYMKALLGLPGPCPTSC